MIAQPASALNAFIEMASTQSYVVLDTETTGLHDGEVIQIAIISHRGEQLLNSYVKPSAPIPPDAQRIHGITDEMVADAPHWGTLIPEIEHYLTGTNVVVYNATYDRKMMHRTAERQGLEKVDWKRLSPWLCAMEAFAEMYGDWNNYYQSYRWQKLTTAATYFGIPTDGAHDALADAQMTLGVVRAMVGKLMSS